MLKSDQIINTNSHCYYFQGDQGFPGLPGRRGAPGVPVGVCEIVCVHFHHIKIFTEGV